jgi:hypothetical protein
LRALDKINPEIGFLIKLIIERVLAGPEALFDFMGDYNCDIHRSYNIELAQ